MHCADKGDIERARAFFSNACEIAQSNYVGTDVLSEYADFLEAHDLPGFAEVYRNEHRQLTEFLAEYDLPKPDYEERLRASTPERREARTETHTRTSG